MISFETLRGMLLGFANEPVRADHSRPDMPMRGVERRDGYTVQWYGKPDDYQVWFAPYSYQSSTGYMGLRIEKSDGVVRRLTFRVAARNAGTTYQYRFNLDEDQPELEMFVGRGADITGEGVSFRAVACIDLVVLDLIEMTLPPQLAVHRPPIGGNVEWSQQYKPCILCGELIMNSQYVCSECIPLQAVTIVRR